MRNSRSRSTSPKRGRSCNPEEIAETTKYILQSPIRDNAKVRSSSSSSNWSTSSSEAKLPKKIKPKKKKSKKDHKSLSHKKKRKHKKKKSRKGSLSKSPIEKESHLHHRRERSCRSSSSSSEEQGHRRRSSSSRDRKNFRKSSSKDRKLEASRIGKRRRSRSFERRSSRRSRSRERRYSYRSRSRERKTLQRSRSRERMSQRRSNSSEREFHRDKTSTDLNRETGYKQSSVDTASRLDEKSELSDNAIQKSEQTRDAKMRRNFSFSSKKIEIKISTTTSNDSKIKNDPDTKTDLIGKWEPVEKKKLKELTDFCKTLVEDEEKQNKQPNNNNEEESRSKEKGSNAVRHPFQVQPAPPLPPPPMIPTIPMNPAQAIQSGMIQQVIGTLGSVPTLPKEIQAAFPVSSGVQHRAKENSNATPNAPVFETVNKPVNISAVIAGKLDAQKAISANPFNIEAIAKLRECDELIKNWSKSSAKPEQFTGEKTKNILTKEELEGGYSAWARKDFFNNLQPIRDGVGLRLLQKMGWTYGQPLGKNRAGFINPVAFEIRTDRRGLSTAEDNVTSLKPKRKGPPVMDVKGKHPVSALLEICTKRKWTLPDYQVVMDTGPAHHKSYLFKVTVNGQDYSPVSPSPNKKNAKAQAATAALHKLGLL